MAGAPNKVCQFVLGCDPLSSLSTTSEFRMWRWNVEIQNARKPDLMPLFLNTAGEETYVSLTTGTVLVTQNSHPGSLSRLSHTKKSCRKRCSPKKKKKEIFLQTLEQWSRVFLKNQPGWRFPKSFSKTSSCSDLEQMCFTVEKAKPRRKSYAGKKEKKRKYPRTRGQGRGEIQHCPTRFIFLHCVQHLQDFSLTHRFAWSQRPRGAPAALTDMDS